MADAKLTALTEQTDPTDDDLYYTVDDPAGTAASRKITRRNTIKALINGMCDGRLTTESGVSVSTSDRTAQGTIYFTPFQGNRVSLYNGTAWRFYNFSEVSLALASLTSAKNYDVFVYDNSGTLTLELSAAWTSDTARADALTTQDGVNCKSGALTRRYLGTIRTTSTTTTEDSGGGVTTQVGGKRFVWNAYNRVCRRLTVIDMADSWTYSTATYRQGNNVSGNKVEAVVGLAGVDIELTLFSLIQNSTGPAAIYVGIGEDSTTVNSASLYPTAVVNATDHYAIGFAILRKPVAIGYHSWPWLEKGSGSGITTWYGDNAATQQSGLIGSIEC